MKKIGFIDYYIEEWHALEYPEMIRKSPFAGRMDVALAWESTPMPGRMSLDEYCKGRKIGKASSVEQVIEECDYLIVLSPDHAEQHEALSELPLRSGKPLYIDKPIAPTRAAAQRLFAKAEQHGTPMFSSSALRFGSGLRNALSGPLSGRRVLTASARGPGVFEIYAIHQLEMVVEAMGPGAKRVMQIGTPTRPSMIIDYGEGRRGQIDQIALHPFQISLAYEENGEGKSNVISAMPDMDDFFPNFIAAMLTFFETGQPPVPKEQTIEIAALLDAGAAALNRPFEWIKVP